MLATYRNFLYTNLLQTKRRKCTHIRTSYEKKMHFHNEIHGSVSEEQKIYRYSAYKSKRTANSLACRITRTCIIVRHVMTQPAVNKAWSG